MARPLARFRHARGRAARARAELISSPFHDRRSERHAVAAPARVRTAHGVAEEATIANISPEGCCVTFGEASLPQGTPVVLRIDDLEGLECTVRWAIGNQAGLEFARRLYGPAMDHVRRKHGLAVRIEPA